VVTKTTKAIHSTGRLSNQSPTIDPSHQEGCVSTL
jgi:hypothetical protein